MPARRSPRLYKPDFIGPRPLPLKRTYGKSASKQLRGVYARMHKFERFPFYADTKKHELKEWKAKSSNKKMQKDLSKLIRAKRNKSNFKGKTKVRDRINKFTMTREGKYMTMLFTPAKRGWDEMGTEQRERYQEYLESTIAEYLSAKSRRKWNRRHTASFFRANILPEIIEARTLIANTIADRRMKDGKLIMDTHTYEGLQRKLSIFDGIIAKTRGEESRPAPLSNKFWKKIETEAERQHPIEQTQQERTESALENPRKALRIQKIETRLEKERQKLSSNGEAIALPADLEQYDMDIRIKQGRIFERGKKRYLNRAKMEKRDARFPYQIARAWRKLRGRFVRRAPPRDER